MIAIISMAIREALEAGRAMKRGREAIREAEKERLAQADMQRTKARNRKKYRMAGAFMGR